MFMLNSRPIDIWHEATKLEKSLMGLYLAIIIFSIFDFVIGGLYDGCHIDFVNLSVLTLVIGSIEIMTFMFLIINLTSNISRRHLMYGINRDFIEFKYEHSLCGTFFGVQLIVIVLCSFVLSWLSYFHVLDKTCQENWHYYYLIIKSTLESIILLSFVIILIVSRIRSRRNYLPI